jgi:hypothetical protein
MRAGFLLGALSELAKLGMVERPVLEKAEEEMEVARLLKEMGEKLGRGIVEELQDEDGNVDIKDGDDASKTWAEVDASWIDELPTLKNWYSVVEEAGRKLGVDLTYKRDGPGKNGVVV